MSSAFFISEFPVRRMAEAIVNGRFVVVSARIYVGITLRVMSRVLHKALASVRLVTRSVTAT